MNKAIPVYDITSIEKNSRKDLLVARFGDLSVAEITYGLNFQDNSYFNRFFKKYTGQTPDAFRKQLINL